MSMTVWGVVEGGLIVPSSALPEGARVEIRVSDMSSEVSADLLAEFEAWDRSSTSALDLVERLSREGEANEAR